VRVSETLVSMILILILMLMLMMMLMMMLMRMAALRGACVSLLRGAFRAVLMAACTWRIARFSQPGGRIDARARLKSLRKMRWFLQIRDHPYGQQAANFTIRTGNFTKNDMRTQDHAHPLPRKWPFPAED
jgi:hypothetical protein